MDLVKIARRVSSGLQHHPLNTMAAVCGVDKINGAYAIVYDAKNSRTIDENGVDCSNKQIDIRDLPEDLSGPLVFDCHTVSLLCKEFLKALAKKDALIEKLKDSDSYFRKTGLHKLSEREKIALGLRPSPDTDIAVANDKHREQGFQKPES